MKERGKKCYVPQKIELSGEHQQGNQGTHQKCAKEHVENAPYSFPEVDLDQEEDPKTPNYDFFIPDLVNFLFFPLF